MKLARYSTLLVVAAVLAAGPSAQAAILTNPAITASFASHPSGSYGAGNVFNGLITDGSGNAYATNGGGTNTFIDFDFGGQVTMDRFLHINREAALDYVTGSTLIFSNNADFSSPVATVPITQSGAGAAYSLNSAITAQYVRWDVTAAGTANPGANEIRFLNTPTGSSILTTTVIGGSAAFNGNYALANAANGVYGSDGTGREYAFNGFTGGGADNMYVDFDLGDLAQATSFDFFDRSAPTDRTTGFKLIYSAVADFSSTLGSEDFTTGAAWGYSGNINAPAGTRYVRFDATTVATANGNTGINDMVFYGNIVPEPSAALLGGIGVLALLRRRRN